MLQLLDYQPNEFSSISDTGISKNRHRNVKRDDLGMFGAKSLKNGTEGIQKGRRANNLNILIGTNEKEREEFQHEESHCLSE